MPEAKNINQIPVADSVESTDSIFISDENYQAKRLGYDTLSDAIITEYTGASLAGTEQTLKSAIDIIGNNVNWNTIPSTVTTLAEFGAYVDSQIATDGFFNGYIDDTIAATIGLSTSTPGDWYAHAFADSAADRYVHAVHVSSKREAILKKVNGTWANSWEIHNFEIVDNLAGETTKNYTALTDIPCPGAGYCTFGNNIGPVTGNQAYSYICFGRTNNPTRTLCVVNSSGDVYVNTYNSSSWTGWKLQATHAEVASLNSVAYHLDRGTAIASSADLNTYKTPGTYYVSNASTAQTLSHCPITNSGFKLIVKLTGAAQSYIVQEAHKYDMTDGEVIYTRSYETSTWSSWIKQPTNSDVEYLYDNSFPVGYGTEVASSTNINSLTGVGVYTIKSSTIASLTNYPSSNAGRLVICNFATDAQAINTANTSGLEILYTTANEIYIRTYSANASGSVTFGSWTKSPTRSEVDTLISKSFKTLDNNTDFNNMTNNGNYIVYTATHAPDTSTAKVYGVEVYSNSNHTSVAQIATEVNTTAANIYKRALNNSTWSNWEKSPTRSEITDINNRTNHTFATNSLLTTQALALSAGFYRGYIASSGKKDATGVPVNANFYVDVDRKDSYAKISITNVGDGYVYTNTYYNSSWTGWLLQPTRGEVDKLYTLQGGMSIPDSVNLNTATYCMPGNYYCAQSSSAATLTNCPTDSAFTMKVESSNGVAISSSSAWAYIRRTIIPFNDPGVTYVQYISTNGTAGAYTYNNWTLLPIRSEVDTLKSSKYGLSYAGMIQLSNNDDLNDYTTPGSYYSGGATTTATLDNVPFTNSGFSLHVESVAGATGQYIIQTIKRISDIADIWTRTYNGSTWTDWEQKPYREEIDQLSNVLQLSGTTISLTSTAIATTVLDDYIDSMNNVEGGFIILNISSGVSVGGLELESGSKMAQIFKYSATNAVVSYFGYSSDSEYLLVKNNGTWNAYLKPRRSEIDNINSDIGRIAWSNENTIKVTTALTTYVDSLSRGFKILWSTGSDATTVGAPTSHSYHYFVNKYNNLTAAIFALRMSDSVNYIYVKQKYGSNGWVSSWTELKTNGEILPTVTSSDNGKFLRVINGAWAATTVPNASGVSF